MDELQSSCHLNGPVHHMISRVCEDWPLMKNWTGGREGGIERGEGGEGGMEEGREEGRIKRGRGGGR